MELSKTFPVSIYLLKLKNKSSDIEKSEIKHQKKGVKPVRR